MIQDISPSVYDNQFQFRKHHAEDYLIGVQDRNLVAKRKERELQFIRFEQLPRYGSALTPEEIEQQVIFLFRIDGEAYYGIDPQLDTHDFLWQLLLQVPEAEEVPISDLREIRPMKQGFAAITAKQLQEWYRARKFCGRCGTPMKKSDTERAMVCPSCNLVEYPKICPAVIVAVTDGDKIMLTKYAGRAYTHYALIAGFTEIGEPLEDTVRREVMEEVGLHVKDITYYKSQPWSFSDTLLAGFFCRLDGSKEVNMDRQELAVAQWTKREDMECRKDDISLTSEMMELFRMGQDPFSKQRD